MKIQYDEVKENYEKVAAEGYSLERFKGLPFPSTVFGIGKHNEYLSSTENLVDQTRSLTNSVIKITKNIANADYSTDANVIKEIYSGFRRNKYNHKYAEFFSSNFSQLTLMADSVNVNYSDLTEQLDNLCKMSKSKFSFMEDMAKLINEYVQIEAYIRKSAYNPEELSIYQEEMEDLAVRHKEIMDAASIYLDISCPNMINKQIKEFNLIKDEILFRISEKDPTLQLNMSELYHRDITLHSGDLASFMLDKKYEDMIVSRITLTESQKIQDYVVFDDSSVCYKKGGVYHVVRDQNNHKHIFSELEHSLISYQLRKKPKIAQYMSNLYTETGYSSTPIGQLEGVLIVIDTYLNNEQILKNMKIDLTFFKDKSFEVVDDYMHELINKHKLNHYANSILSNKNKHLLNDASLESFKVLMDSGVSKGVIQNLVGKKLSAINTQEEFEKYLEKVIEHISSFSEDILMDKLNTNNIKPVINKNNIVIFEIDTFAQSQQLGSPSWCIARSDYYFNLYKNEDTKQYFMYDFNKDEKDNQSMIGFTVNKDGSMKTQHAKNDDYHEVDDYLQKVINKILYLEQSSYTLSQDVIEKLEQEFNPKTKKKTHQVNTL
jgi:hypothetical protein